MLVAVQARDLLDQVDRLHQVGAPGRGDDGEVVAVNEAVARDVFLDGSTFRDRSPSVSKKVLQGEFQAGVALMAYGLRVSYTQTWRTEEFRGQRAGLFSFGSLAVSAKF